MAGVISSPTTELKPTCSLVDRSGRWSCSPEHTLTASWCGASLRFHFSGLELRIRPGGGTQRRDSWNGGTPMLLWTVTIDGAREPLLIESADPEPSRDLVLVDTKRVPQLADYVYCIEITLIDWASVCELEAIIVESEECIKPLPVYVSTPPPIRTLFIGDSICCGYTLSPEDGGQPFPRGSLNAFPSIARRLLRDKETAFHLQVETVAYPGITLVNPTKEEAEEGMSQGMADKFFHISPWDSSPSPTREYPSMMIIALGTNDEACDVSADRFSATLRDFLRRLINLYEGSLTRVLIVDPFPDFTDTEDIEPSALSAAIAVVIDQLHGQYRGKLSLHTLNIAMGMTRAHTMDGLHPTLEGHELLGRNLAERLAEILSHSEVDQVVKVDNAK